MKNIKIQKEDLNNYFELLEFITKDYPINNHSDLIKEQLNSKLFFLYDATDSKDLKNGYVMKLHAVRSDGKKISIDLLIGDVFFDIKLNDEELIDEYVDEFEADSYDTFYKQLFDSTERHKFIRLYFKDHTLRRNALEKIKKIQDDLSEEYEEVKNSLKDERDICEQIEEFWNRYDTYSDDHSCHYRKIARENDFEIVGWYRLIKEDILLTESTSIHLSDIEKIDYNEQPKLLILSWDIETSSTRGPGYFPVGEQEEDYVYMIQVDLYWLSVKELVKRYCLTTIPVNKELFERTYQILMNNFEFMYCESQEQIILRFAEIVRNYKPDIDCRYNIFGYD